MINFNRSFTAYEVVRVNYRAPHHAGRIGNIEFFSGLKPELALLNDSSDLKKDESPCTAVLSDIGDSQILFAVDYNHLWKYPVFDWANLDLNDEEQINRFYRTSGGVTCIYCPREYRYHPIEQRVKNFHGEPWLRQLCNGGLGHL